MRALWLIFFCFAAAAQASAADVFVRFRLLKPLGDQSRITVSGWRHEDPWFLPTATVDVKGGAWSGWLDLSKWPWHGRLNRSGGVAEWPALRASVSRVAGDDPRVAPSALEVQLADRADETAVVHQFVEESESDTIAFLVPTPLREHRDEFETGSRMAGRHRKWADEAVAAGPVTLKDFTFITALWGPYDPALARQEIGTLKRLGFNVIGNVDPRLLRESGLRTYQTTWLYEPDPEEVNKKWQAFATGPLKLALSSESARWPYVQAAHWVVGDEVQTLSFTGLPPERVNSWFREYLHQRGVGERELGMPLDRVEYPAAAMHEKTLPRDAELSRRVLLYHAAKFGHWWSAKQLRGLSDLIRSDVPGAVTETLPSDHGFFHAWGPPQIGMSYRMLDLFELGAQRSVDQISAEDWMGLNHMYGPDYTWTGAQSFEYFNAICRSAMQGADKAVLLRGLVTPSDDAYLRLKAYSAIGQGAKSFFFWTYGPTYIGTENYWSDLRSQYDGIVKLARAVQQAEPILCAGGPVSDPVAILYSVSHDIWHSDDPAAFVEKRLLWHALRHLHVQPDFIREEDAAARLKNFKVLYITDGCVSRAASRAIEQWVRGGGVVYLSAGAATRDEFYEPYVPPYAVHWNDRAATLLKSEKHTYNERVDLPSIAPMSRATVKLHDQETTLPVLGCQLKLKDQADGVFARFDDGSSAGAVTDFGKGKVISLGFMPMLAYGQGAGFKPEMLEERWPEGPRRLPEMALKLARIDPVTQCDHPVVETSLIRGERGCALVLVNYTYQPIKALSVELKLPANFKRVRSTQGSQIVVEQDHDKTRLRLPLSWTDIVLFE